MERFVHTLLEPMFGVDVVKMPSGQRFADIDLGYVDMIWQRYGLGWPRR